MSSSRGVALQPRQSVHRRLSRADPGQTVSGIPDSFTFSRTFAQPERFNGVPQTTQYMFAAGLTGKLGKWDWNVAYTRGDSKLRDAAAQQRQQPEAGGGARRGQRRRRSADLLCRDPGGDGVGLCQLRAAQPVRPDLGQRGGDRLYPRRHRLHRQAPRRTISLPTSAARRSTPGPDRSLLRSRANGASRPSARRARQPRPSMPTAPTCGTTAPRAT